MDQTKILDLQGRRNGVAPGCSPFRESLKRVNVVNIDSGFSLQRGIKHAAPGVNSAETQTVKMLESVAGAVDIQPQSFRIRTACGGNARAKPQASGREASKARRKSKNGCFLSRKMVEAKKDGSILTTLYHGTGGTLSQEYLLLFLINSLGPGFNRIRCDSRSLFFNASTIRLRSFPYRAACSFR